jgi:hypothetical protein
MQTNTLVAIKSLPNCSFVRLRRAFDDRLAFGELEFKRHSSECFNRF